MSLRRELGIVPLLLGVILAGGQVGSLWGSPTIADGAIVTGGCAGILVGVALLAGWGEFSAGANSLRQSLIVPFAWIALLSTVAGFFLLGVSYVFDLPYWVG